ncbi:MAG: hypothetical protein ACI35W_05125 [Anaeroplasmataceae bacterium]
MNIIEIIEKIRSIVTLENVFYVLMAVAIVVYLPIDVRNRKRKLENALVAGMNENEVEEYLSKSNELSKLNAEDSSAEYCNWYKTNPGIFEKVSDGYLNGLISDLVLWMGFIIIAISSVGFLYLMKYDKKISQSSTWIKFKDFMDLKLIIIGVVSLLLIILVPIIIIKIRNNKSRKLNYNQGKPKLIILIGGLFAVGIGILINFIICLINKSSHTLFIILYMILIFINGSMMFWRNDPIMRLFYKLPVSKLSAKTTSTTYDVYEVYDAGGTIKDYKGQETEYHGFIWTLLAIAIGIFKVVIILLYLCVSPFATIALSYLYIFLFLVFLLIDAKRLNDFNKSIRIFKASNVIEEKNQNLVQRMLNPKKGDTFCFFKDGKFNELVEYEMLESLCLTIDEKKRYFTVAKLINGGKKNTIRVYEIDVENNDYYYLEEGELLTNVLNAYNNGKY